MITPQTLSHVNGPSPAADLWRCRLPSPSPVPPGKRIEFTISQSQLSRLHRGSQTRSASQWSRTILRIRICRTGETERCTMLHHQCRVIVPVVPKFDKNASTRRPEALPGDRGLPATGQSRQRPAQASASIHPEPATKACSEEIRDPCRGGVPRQRHVSQPTSARRSSVNIAQDKVDRPDDGDHVGDELVADHVRQRAEVAEGGGADLAAVGAVAAVADDVEAELAAR